MGVRDRLLARVGHYAAYTVLFAFAYAAVRAWLGTFPELLLVGILVASLAKDVFDEVRIQRGGRPLAYAGFEHAPSNVVLIVMLAVGFVDPAGSVGLVSVRNLAIALAAVDLVFDLSQDARTA